MLEKMAEHVTREEKLKGALAYISGPISGITILGPLSSSIAIFGLSSGIIFLIIGKKSSFIRFHAMQSILVFGAFFLFNVILGIVPLIGWIVQVIISPGLFLAVCILWFVLMYKAYTGEKYLLPYFGELAEKQLKKLK